LKNCDISVNGKENAIYQDWYLSLHSLTNRMRVAQLVTQESKELLLEQGIGENDGE